MNDPEQETGFEETILPGVTKSEGDSLRYPEQLFDDPHGEPDDSSTRAGAEALRPWRAAGCLMKLREQVNATYPSRRKESDGMIGDPRHQSRSSDHNAWVVDGAKGVVTAFDITHDPGSGCDAGRIARAIHGSRDPRVKYIIWNRQIANSSSINGAAPWAWRAYRGANPHTKHVHISVQPIKALYDDTTPWTIGSDAAAAGPGGGAREVVVGEGSGRRTDRESVGGATAQVERHRRAIERLRDNPEDEEAARELYELITRDAPGARAALEQHTAGAAASERFVAPSRLPRAEDFVERNMTPPGIPKAPQSKAELVALMHQAASEWTSMKAIGAGYAFTTIDDTPGYRLLMSKYLDAILPIDTAVLRDRTGRHLLQFEAGATVEDLTTYLWSQLPKKALLNQPGYEKLTFLGVATAGGHGSGIKLGPIAEAIRSLRLLTFDEQHNVVERQIERASGITDPIAFAQKYPDVDLIQDDTVFNACVVSMGSFGIVYSVTIAVQDGFHLREDRTKRSWAHVSANLRAMLDDPSMHSIQIWLNPYDTPGGQHCVVSEYHLDNGPRRGERGIGIQFGNAQAAVDVMLWVTRNIPRATPGLVSSSLDATLGTNVVMPCWEALNFGGPNRLKAIGIDYGVDVDDAVAAADALSRALREFGRQTGTYLLSPLGIRFVKATDAIMSPAYKRDTCMIEMPVLDGLRDPEGLISLYIRTIAPFNARPHWGQRNDVNRNTIGALFPEYERFREIYARMNPSGLFANEFTRRIGLSN